MTVGRRKKNEDPLDQYVSCYLAVLEWHAFYEGPRFERREVPYHDWRTHSDKIAHEDELEDEEWFSLDLVLEPYQMPLTVSKREITRFRFTVTSSSEAHGGLFQTNRDGNLHGWVHFPFPGVPTLLMLLASGHQIVLEVNGSAFKRGTAFIRSNSSWRTAGHPDLDAEFA